MPARGSITRLTRVTFSYNLIFLYNFGQLLVEILRSFSFLGFIFVNLNFETFIIFLKKFEKFIRVTRMCIFFGMNA